LKIQDKHRFNIFKLYIKTRFNFLKKKLRAVEPEPVKKPEEEEPAVAEAGPPPNAKAGAKQGEPIKKVEGPPPPIQYCGIPLTPPTMGVNISSYLSFYQK
jgi:hypothetical protein